MSQSLWYLRHEGRVVGPFPAPQIEEALNLGEVSADWEISLDRVEWIGIADSTQFKAARAAWMQGESRDSEAWREQRLRARQRWLQDVAGGPGISLSAQSVASGSAATSFMDTDPIRAQAVLQARKSKRTATWGAVLGLLFVAGAGIAVWLGQSNKKIQAGVEQSANCGVALSDAVNWAGCDRRGIAQPGGVARNARMDKVLLDDAQLRGADLAYGSFKNASLRNAELSEVNLTGADLSGADLTGADLSRADLRYAVLTGAKLTGVRFNATRLDKATWFDGRVCAPGSTDVCQ